MRNIKVAILDTGIADELVDNRIKLRKQIYYDYYDEKIVYKDNATDYNGHGTVCVNTMWSVFDNIDVYAVNVMGISGRANIRTFAEGLSFAKTLDVDIISVCSSLIVEDEDPQIKKICDEITASGKVLVAAVQNGRKSSAIANYPGVIGVLGANIEGYSYAFDRKKAVQMICDNKNYIVEGRKLLCECFFGNSRATAIATGIIAKLLFDSFLCENDINNIDIIDALEKNVNKDVCERVFNEQEKESILGTSFDIAREKYLVENEENYHKLIYLLCEYLECDNSEIVRKNRLWDINNNYLLTNIGPLFQILKERLGISIKMLKVDSLEYAYTLYDACYNSVGAKC